MSVIMTMRLKGDPKKLEEHAASDPDRIRAIRDRAVDNGLIAHRFYGSDDGQIVVIDEWPDAESFQKFFSEAGGEIQPIMEAVGVAGEPEITFWRKLDSQDEYGWGA